MRRKARRLTIAIVCALIVAPVVPTGAQAVEPIELIGILPLPHGVTRAEVSNESLITINESRRELIGMYQRSVEPFQRITIYDLRSRIPRFVKEFPLDSSVQLAGTRQLLTALDTKRNQLFILEAGIESNEFQVPNVLAVNLDSGAFRQQPLPFQPEGITYAPVEDRIYLVGDTATRMTSNWTGMRAQSLTMLMSLDPLTLVPEWIIPVRQCQQPMYLWFSGAPLYRSAVSSSIYFPCARTRTAPRVSGLVRVNLGDESTQIAASQYPIDFFPISGAYFQPPDVGVVPLFGIVSASAFEKKTDRIFLQSLSQTTPGAWVFDGRMSAWAGFVATPDPWGTTGISQFNCHYYASDPAVQRLLVSDGCGTPIPQGDFYDGYSFNRYILADPGSTRFIGLVPERDLHLSQEATVLRWAVFDDHTESEDLATPVDYDSMTSDVEEGSDTVSTFAGGITGYGSRVHLVGGLGGTKTTVYNQKFDPNNVGLNPGDREFYLGRVARLDIRDTGSSATAQAIAADSGTQDEWNTRPNTVASSCRSSAQKAAADGANCKSADPTLKDASEKMDPWPWSPASCLAGNAGAADLNDSKSGSAGTDAEQPTQIPGEANVSCSLRKQQSKAHADFTGFGGKDDPLSVMFSSVDATTRRVPEEGALTDVLALARGIEIRTAAGTLKIGEVSAHGATTAHGRRTTASTTWDRRLSGVILEQPGRRPQRFPDCENDGCQPTLREISRELGEFVKLEMPSADRQATPAGAYAGIQRTTADYLEGLTVYNDDTKSVPALQATIYADREQKLRLFAQFAGLEASSLYTISKIGGGVVGGPTGGTTVLGDQLTNPRGSTLPPAPTDRFIVREIPRLATDVIGFLIRSPIQALQMAIILLMLAAAPASIMRRQRFRTTIDNGGIS